MDLEYTNGNFYLGDIFEIACLSEDSGRIYHSYINIPTTITSYIKKMCCISDELIRNSSSFYIVMQELVDFIEQEEGKNKSSTTIVSHGGYLSDFPLLLANCMKFHYDYTTFFNYKFIDSMQIFQSMGYHRPGLESLANTKRKIHTATQDVQLLKDVITTYNIDISRGYTLSDILQYMNRKLPISIPDLYKLVSRTTSFNSLESMLRPYSGAKNALNKKQLYKIVYRYLYIYIP